MTDPSTRPTRQRYVLVAVVFGAAFAIAAISGASGLTYAIIGIIAAVAYVSVSVLSRR